MKILDFIKKYDAGNIDLSNHVRDVYVSYAEKVARASNIIDFSCWKTVTFEDGRQERILYVNSPLKEMLTGLTIIELYTDIELRRDDAKSLEDFDLLNSRRIIKQVIDQISYNEKEEFYRIVKMAYDDLFTNEYENHAYVRNAIEKFRKIIEPVIPSIVENLNALSSILTSGDFQRLNS